MENQTSYQFLFDGITSVMAIVAFIFSIISFLRSNAYTKAQVEISIRNMIFDAKEKFYEFSNNSDVEKKLILSSVFEDYLNAYDEACAKYIDNKIDKVRFKKMYVDEIKNLVECKNGKEKIDTDTTRFRAIRKVYNEWNNLEK